MSEVLGGVEGKVQIAPDSTGQNVRTLRVTTLVPDPAVPGTLLPATVEMQVMAISDLQGNLMEMDFPQTNKILLQILDTLLELKWIEEARESMVKA